MTRRCATPQRRRLAAVVTTITRGLPTKRGGAQHRRRHRALRRSAPPVPTSAENRRRDPRGRSPNRWRSPKCGHRLQASPERLPAGIRLHRGDVLDTHPRAPVRAARLREAAPGRARRQPRRRLSTRRTGVARVARSLREAREAGPVPPTGGNGKLKLPSRNRDSRTTDKRSRCIASRHTLIVDASRERGRSPV
jgi:hypothetical protein